MLSGEMEALAEANEMAGLDDDDIIAIAEFYVLRVMLFRGASPRRILGVDSGAERSQVRRHMGYLMSWLHPDKGSSAWRAVFARRVLDAWHRIDRGSEEEAPQAPSLRARSRHPLFLIPWISMRPERAARAGFMSFWRKLMPLGAVGFILSPCVELSDDLGRVVWRTLLADSLTATTAAIAGPTGADPGGVATDSYD
jgi:hypothetical protein